MNKIYLALLGLFLVPLTLTSQYQNQSSDDPQTQKRHEVHSKLYRHYEDNGASTIEEMLQKQGGDVSLATETMGRSAQFPGKTQTDEDKALLLSLAGRSDLIVTGHFASRTSALTEHHKFVFSDWTFVVDSVLKDRQQRVSVRSQIIVTRPGGVVDVNGRHVTAADTGFKEFSTSKQYLLMLRYVAETSSYLADAAGSFELTPEGAESCDNASHDLPKRLGAPFLQEVQNAIQGKLK